MLPESIACTLLRPCMLTPQVRQFRPDALPILFVGSSSGEVVFCTLELGSAPAIASVGEQQAAFWMPVHSVATQQVAFADEQAVHLALGNGALTVGRKCPQGMAGWCRQAWPRCNCSACQLACWRFQTRRFCFTATPSTKPPPQRHQTSSQVGLNITVLGVSLRQVLA
jgi:hypothetical protein